MASEKGSCLSSSQQQQQWHSAESDFYLPEECWEHVFTFINNHTCDFNSLSLVSKQFLSITNRLLFSLTIRNPQLCVLRGIFHRFSNLSFLDLRFNFHDLDADIALALRDIPTLKSLSLFSINLNYEWYVTSLFVDSLVSLKGLISLKFRGSKFSDHLLYSIAREALPLKRFVIKYCTGYTINGIYCLLSNCHTIQRLGLQDDHFLNDDQVHELSLLLPHLVSINLSQCSKLTESALFALIRNCRLLDEIKIKDIDFGNFYCVKDFDVNPQLKSLSLACNSSLNDESILMFAYIFPNLQLLDLSYCNNISQKGIGHVLSRCGKVRNLNLTEFHEVRLLKMNFVVPQLEVLNLSYTRVDDKTLYEISKSCHGLLKLLLTHCNYVTKKGLISVIENCTGLKEINLRYCNKVEADVVVSEVLSRPSSKKRKLFSEDECIYFY